MNAAKSILKSALDAAGNPPLVASKLIHAIEKDPQYEYGVALTEETLKRLGERPGRWNDARDLMALLDSTDGFTVTIKDDNAKHGGATLKVTREGFAISVGTDWHHVPSMTHTLILPLGIGKLCWRIVYWTNTRTSNDRSTVRIF